MGAFKIFSLVLIFYQCDYDTSKWALVLFFLCSGWYSLSFLNLWFVAFVLILKNTFSLYLFKYCFCSIISLFFSTWDFNYTHVIVPHFYFFPLNHFPSCVILRIKYIDLSLSVLIISSVLSSLLWVTEEFFIFHVVLFPTISI